MRASAMSVRDRIIRSRWQRVGVKILRELTLAGLQFPTFDVRFAYKPEDTGIIEAY